MEQNGRTGYLASFAFSKWFWFAVYVASQMLCIVAAFAPHEMVQFARFRSASTASTIIRMLQTHRLAVLLIPLVCLGATIYFRTVQARARTASSTLLGVRFPLFNTPLSRSRKALLALLAVVCLLVWMIPIGDGLQDDEGDKLRAAILGWDYWGANVFNTRINILPITLARLVYLLIPIRAEWLLRLPLLLVFGLPLLYLLAVPFRKRYGIFVSALLLAFFGLSGIMGEYASKVQGYLSALTFSAATFILWGDMIHQRYSERVVRQGMRLVICCLCAYLSHNFTLFFLLGLFSTALLIDVMNRVRRHLQPGVNAAIGYMSMGLVLIGATVPFGIRSILFHVTEGETRHSTLGVFYTVLVSAMTGASNWIGLMLLVGCVVCLLAVWRWGGERYRAELALGVILVLGLAVYYWIFEPRFFIDRFMIWLPLVWLVILGEGIWLLLKKWLPTNIRPTAYAIVAMFFVLFVIPSQISWQQTRSAGVNLRQAAEAGLALAEAYEAKGYTTGFMLLRSHGNYSHRMWFYFPEGRTVSDRDSDASAAELSTRLPSQVWIIPAAKNDFEPEYDWIMERAVESRTAGNMTLYVVFSHDLREEGTEMQTPIGVYKAR